jgi:hypothetical protein
VHCEIYPVRCADKEKFSIGGTGFAEVKGGKNPHCCSGWPSLLRVGHGGRVPSRWYQDDACRMRAVDPDQISRYALLRGVVSWMRSSGVLRHTFTPPTRVAFTPSPANCDRRHPSAIPRQASCRLKAPPHEPTTTPPHRRTRRSLSVPCPPRTSACLYNGRMPPCSRAKT